jgi:hypothetical protein
MKTGSARSTGLALIAAGLATAGALRAKRTLRAYDFSGKSVVITGGSRGLGLVLGSRLSVRWHSSRQRPVSWCGACTALDSGEYRCLRYTASHTIDAMARNSLCQFWNDSNQKRADKR